MALTGRTNSPYCRQDPVTAHLCEDRDAPPNNDFREDSAAPAPVTATALRGSPADFPPLCRGQRPTQCTWEWDQLRKKMERKLEEERRENEKLRAQIRRQFLDLDQLGDKMGSLASQVEEHEAVIRQQSLRIQAQETTIQQLNQRLQQYLAELIQCAYKTIY